MKKIYFAMMALFMALTASAQVEVDITYVDGTADKADAVLYDSEASQWMAGYNGISEGQVTLPMVSWGANCIVYVGVDASGLDGFVKKATLTAEVSGSTDSKRGTSWGVGYNNTPWTADMTYNTADKSITLVGRTVNQDSKSSTSFKAVSFDVTDAFANGKVTTLLIYETAAAGGYIQNIKVEVEMASSALEAAQYQALQKIEGAKVGLFAYSQEGLDAYKAAVNAATTVEEVKAIAMPEIVKPAAGEVFKVANVSAAGMYLGEANLSDVPTVVMIEEAAGGYYLNVNGQYVNMAGGNTWSMNASETASTAWKLNIVDNGYTIQGPNGLIGTDKKDAGSATFGNKAVANNGVWTIESMPESYASLVKAVADAKAELEAMEEGENKTNLTSEIAKAVEVLKSSANDEEMNTVAEALKALVSEYTAIKSVSVAKTNVVKFIENGQVKIVKNGKKINVAGVEF